LRVVKAVVGVGAELIMRPVLVVLARLYPVKDWHQIRQVLPGAKLAKPQTVDGLKVAMLPVLAVLYMVRTDVRSGKHRPGRSFEGGSD
jgi:hypothetical protein